MPKKSTKKYWFRRKAYGWGWYPVTWQGWLTIVIFVATQLWNAFRFQSSTLSKNQVVCQLLIVTTLSTLVLIWVCLKTGEKPKWQWGGH